MAQKYCNIKDDVGTGVGCVDSKMSGALRGLIGKFIFWTGQFNDTSIAGSGSEGLC